MLFRSALISFLVACTGSALAADKQASIRIVGSSSLYTMTTHVAEVFGKSSPYPAPVVESTGTGGGFKLFCAGNGDNTPDIAMASRPMTESERNWCKQNGVPSPVALPLGTGGVIVASGEGPVFRLTLRHLWLALAAQVPVNGAMATNPYTRWNEIDPTLPDLAIQVYGPPPTSGTHDALLGMILDPACHEDPVMAAMPLEQRLQSCEKLREDGAYIHAGESDEMLSRRLLANPKAVGIVGYHVLEQHRGLKAATINGIDATTEHIAAGRYPLVRTLYLYVKGDHIARTPGLGQFVGTYTADAMIGPEGRLGTLGLVPLAQGDRRQTKERTQTLGPGI